MPWKKGKKDKISVGLRSETEGQPHGHKNTRAHGHSTAHEGIRDQHGDPAPRPNRFFSTHAAARFFVSSCTSSHSFVIGS